MKYLLYILLFFSVLTNCCDEDSDNDVREPIETQLTYQPLVSLKELASFPVGMIVSAQKLATNTQFKEYLNNDFNSITAENDMKMRSIFIGPNNYDFSKGDAIISYAKQNGFRVFGHALIWHSSIPDWLVNFTGTDMAFEELIETYIKETVAHFSQEKIILNGQEISVVAGWDVVNEAFTDAAQNAVFRTRLGDDYVAKCFQWAREADPHVKLFYNDYNLESQSSKMVEVIGMLDDFTTRNIPIDGIGMQMHIDYISPSIQTIQSNLNALLQKDVLIHFSELDMTVNKTGSLSELTFLRAKSQEDKYRAVAELYSEIPENKRFGITLWGMRDVESWLLNFHGNINEYPLLFDASYNFKLAHRGFSEGLN